MALPGSARPRHLFPEVAVLAVSALFVLSLAGPGLASTERSEKAGQPIASAADPGSADEAQYDDLDDEGTTSDDADDGDTESDSSAVQYVLSVTKTGSGSGLVSSSPAGITCGATCSANFNAATVVTLTASPAVGSSFAGWSGACTGTGLCTVTMSSAQSVTAMF